MSQQEYTARLEDWTIMIVCAYGEIHDDIHERWENGHRIRTSTVIEANREPKEGDIIKTRNSTYLLGKPAVIA